MLFLANSGRTSYAWTDADMRRSAVPLEDAKMFNTVADEIDGFDLGTNAGCASYRPRAALLPVCYQLAALWQPSPTCWMSPLGEWSNDRGLCEPLSHRMRRSLTSAGGGPCPHAIHSPRAYCEHGQWAVARNHGSGF